MTNESNSDSYPGLVSSACLSTDTESLAHSQESNSTDIWKKLPVRKYTDENSNKKKWECLNCRKVFNDWNLTKAVHHVAQQNSNDIAKCKTLLGE